MLCHSCIWPLGIILINLCKDKYPVFKQGATKKVDKRWLFILFLLMIISTHMPVFCYVCKIVYPLLESGTKTRDWPIVLTFTYYAMLQCS